MLRYDKIKHFAMDEIDHKIYSKSRYNKYQKYFDKYDYIIGPYYIEHLRILFNFYDEKRYTIKTKKKCTKYLLDNMIKCVEKECDILEITENWLGEKKLNEDNMNDGHLEWFIKLKNKPKLKYLDHIGGQYNNINIIEPTYTPEYIIRFDHNNGKYKIPIFILLNGKMYDKVWYYSEKKNISINEIYNYSIYYVKKLKSYVEIQQIIMSYTGWVISLWS